MAELTPEEKQKIYLEEKERIAAADKIKKEAAEKQSKAAKNGCLIIFAIVMVVILISVFKPSKPTPPAPSPLELSANVQRNQTQIIVKNNDTFDWTNVKVELNAKGFKSGYSYKTARLAAGQSITIGLLNFTKSDGERMNPFAIQAKSVFISADTPRGQAIYAGGWD